MRGWDGDGGLLGVCAVKQLFIFRIVTGFIEASAPSLLPAVCGSLTPLDTNQIKLVHVTILQHK